MSNILQLGHMMSPEPFPLADEDFSEVSTKMAETSEKWVLTYT